MPWNPVTLKRLRERKGWSQVELAQRAGTHPISIAKIETGGRVPGLDLAERLAKALGVKVDGLLRK